MFFPIGSVNHYAKIMDLQKKATLKIKNYGNENSIAGLLDAYNNPKEKIEAKTGVIYDKLRRGEELSSYDLEYLRQNAPELYKKAVQIARERKEFEQRLKSCKTKEEAQSLKLQKTTFLSSQILSGQNTPNAQGHNDFIYMRLQAVNNVFDKFVRSQHYKLLPTEDEKMKTDTVDISNFINHLEIKKRNRN